MLPDKKYEPAEVLRIAVRRFWAILVPVAVVGAGAAGVASKLQDTYRSEALIMVTPERVPQSTGRPAVTKRLEDRLQAMSPRILNRTRLEGIIQDLDLADITVQVVKEDEFRVSYVGREPRTVMKVTNRLASLFIEEDLRERESLAGDTNQFLEARVEEARQQLIESEKKVEAYRRQHTGQMISQLTSNLQAIQKTEMQIQATRESLNRDRDERSMIERQLADVESPSADLQLNDETQSGDTTREELARVRNTLSQLETRLGATHPDVQEAKRTLSELELKLAMQTLLAVANGTPAPQSTLATSRQRKLEDLRARLDHVHRQIASKEEYESHLRKVAADYQQLVDEVPGREPELAELTRDYETLQTLYTTLLSKNYESKISAMERSQSGGQFRLSNAAQMPENPLSPNRKQIVLYGLAVGLAIGLVLAFLLEYRDSSFKTDDEVASLLSLPVLAVVPLMRSEQDRREALRKQVMVGVGLGSTVAACTAIVAYTFLR